MYSSKSVEVAGILGIILGSVGAHDWYLGNKKGALMHVGLLVLSVMLLIVGSIVLPLTNSGDMEISEVLGTVTMVILVGNAAWGVLEGILILAQGRTGLVRREEKARMLAQQRAMKAQKK